MKETAAKKTPKKMSSEKYSELLKCVDLHDIYLRSSKVDVNKVAFRDKAELQYKEDAKLIELQDTFARIEVNYLLKAKSKRRNVFEISVRFCVDFETKRDIPTEFFDIYNETSLPLQTFPYFREFVQSTVARMGLPPLIIPLRKFLVAND